MKSLFHKKLVLLLAVFLLASLAAQAQKYSFESFDDIVLYEYDLATEKAKAPLTRKLCRAGVFLAKVGTVKDDSALGSIQVVRIIDFPLPSTPAAPASATTPPPPALGPSVPTIDHRDNGMLYRFKTADLKEGMLRKRYQLTYNGNGWLPAASPAFGTIIVPFKSRRSVTVNNQKYASSFSSSTTIGPSLGARFRISRYNPHYLSVMGVYGLANASVDSATTQGFEKKNKELAAITKAIGLVLEFDNVQAGFFIGDDKLSGETGNRWVHNGRRWFAVGIGYQFIKQNEKQE